MEVPVLQPKFRKVIHVMAISAAAIALVPAPRAFADSTPPTATPIKHVIIVIGENHTFDNLFGGYKPGKGQMVHNLLSQGIINADGSPGPNFSKAVQQQAGNTSVYRIDPAITGPFSFLPQPQTTYATGLPPACPTCAFPPI
ncbi:MAG: hypothetical protein JSV72_22325 [Ralstonia sp.]|nr:MAG: hypothetical protein JSV72_22325 [Ralstonia sp.]